MTWTLSLLLLLCLIVMLLFTFDDLFVDLIALTKGLRPKELHPLALEKITKLPEKQMAILVANWKEEEILSAMVRGNVDRILYQNYRFFLGVYPNDLPTWEVARRLEQSIPQVSVIVNDRPGPTSKGQLLNYMVKSVLEAPHTAAQEYDALLLHDSEDIIHPLSLRLINSELENADFVQIPVFSLFTPYKQLTAGTYADEFAEAHTKTLLVRDFLGAAIPSAGVGTAISLPLVKACRRANRGDLLNEKTLTEDYQLGLIASRLGFRSRFSCAYLKKNGKRDYIATREFFPEKVSASIRQKTRWVIGIAFQGKENLGWGKTLQENYFLWRDRRGPVNALMIFANTLIVFFFLSYLVACRRFPELPLPKELSILFTVNLSQMGWRILVRIYHTSKIYGLFFGLLAPIRWPLANYINCLSSWRAFRSFRESKKTKKQIAWVKTQHKLPSEFGREEAGKHVA